jgi:hypothetical protein
MVGAETYPTWRALREYTLSSSVPGTPSGPRFNSAANSAWLAI